MKIKLLFTFLIISMLSQGQQKIEKHYFNDVGRETDSINAVTIQHYVFTDTIQGSGVIKYFEPNGRLFKEIEYSNINRNNDSIEKWTRDGFLKIYHDNGELKIQESYKNDKLDGEVTTYFEKNQQLKRKDIFKENKFVSGTCYDENGKEIDHFDYFVKPTYDGGNRAIYKFIAKKMQYPKRMRAMGQEGKVLVRFIVTKEATLKGIRILRSPSSSFSKEALRVVNLLKKWKPGVRDGEKIDVSFILPISFKLQ